MATDSHTPSDYFYAWERRGRGELMWQQPVELEPPFVPFIGHQPDRKDQFIDDTRDPRLISRLLGTLAPSDQDLDLDQSDTISPQEYYPVLARTSREGRPRLVEHQLQIKTQDRSQVAQIQRLLLVLGRTRWPLAFEVIGTANSIVIQWTSRASEAAHLSSQLKAFFPNHDISTSTTYLKDLWKRQRTGVIELALDRETMLPLALPNKLDPDPLLSAFGVLESLRLGELAGWQVLFTTAQQPWGEHWSQSLLNTKGRPFFAEHPGMIKGCQAKTASPLLAARVSLFVGSSSLSRRRDLAGQLVAGLQSATTSRTNRLAILNTRSLSQKHLARQVVYRQSYRSGSLLSTHELANLVHLPGPDIVSKKLAKVSLSVGQQALTQHHDYIIGQSSQTGESIGLSERIRKEHIHIVGASGKGKSTLVVNMVMQDVLAGRGCGVFDPHGDLVQDILERIPEEHHDRVILVNTGDPDYAVGINVIEARTRVEETLLASDFLAVFKRYTGSWGANMEMVLRYAIEAFVKSQVKGTLLDVERFLRDTPYRQSVVATVKDPIVKNFWATKFSGKALQRAATSVQSRLEDFLLTGPIRYMLVQKEGLHFRQIMDQQKILLVSLAKGATGKTNGYVLCGLFLNKLMQAAQTRTSKASRSPYFLYLDEFQNFVTDDLKEMLSEIRKFGVGTVLVHQYLDQVAEVSQGVLNALNGNVTTRICFKVGIGDAHRLAKDFRDFDFDDINNLERGQVIMKTEGVNMALRTSLPKTVNPAVAKRRLATIKALSRQRYARPIDELKQEIAARYQSNPKPIPPSSPAPAPKTTPPSLSRHHQLKLQAETIGRRLGFSPDPEAQTPDQTGLVDILLVKGNMRVGIEINVNNTAEYEASNILKCVNAGYDHTIWYCSDPSQHLEVDNLINDRLTHQQKETVLFVSSEAELETTLQFLAGPAINQVTTQVVDGEDETPVRNPFNVFSQPPNTDESDS